MILPFLFMGLCYSAAPKKPDIPPLELTKVLGRRWKRLTDKEVGELLKLKIPKSKPVPIPKKPDTKKNEHRTKNTP